MNYRSPHCANLSEQVNILLDLLQQEPTLHHQQDTTAIEASLAKAVSPKFEIVFAGAFSAGKSMLINALLERELLYSAEGHATGTECYIDYAEPEAERVVLTFLSEAEIREQASLLCQKLGIFVKDSIHQPEVIKTLQENCRDIITQEGGESKSERAKQAKALSLLLEGFVNNRDRIHTTQNATYSMEQFHFSNLAEAAGYARRGSNSADLIQTQFRDNARVYKTSGLLGFYGSQIKNTNSSDRFGLNTIFAESVKGIGGEEETPQFVSEFNNYCANSGKLTRTNFKVSVNSYETPNENYFRILNESGTALIQQLITDSGIEEFRTAITRYLTEEKSPQLFATLADDLQPLCINLKQYYLQQLQDLDSQPHEIEAMKQQELRQLNQQLQQVGKEFCFQIETEVNSIVTNSDPTFEDDFRKLKARMVSRLDELLQTFSVANAYSRATFSHPRNATAPLIAVLVEALYHLANELEDVLVEESNKLVHIFCQRLLDRVKQAEYYRQLYRLLGNDGGIETQLKQLEIKLTHALISEAKTECDRYVRESPRFYDEGTFSIYQFRQTLQQTSQGYDCQSMVEAEPAIRQLLKQN
jgi:replication fork clamp-binding protein CrfC